jgi:hypothetical protein
MIEFLNRGMSRQRAYRFQPNADYIITNSSLYRIESAKLRGRSYNPADIGRDMKIFDDKAVLPRYSNNDEKYNCQKDIRDALHRCGSFSLAADVMPTRHFPGSPPFGCVAK